jgi:hypothetical protein
MGVISSRLSSTIIARVMNPAISSTSPANSEYVEYQCSLGAVGIVAQHDPVVLGQIGQHAFAEAGGRPGDVVAAFALPWQRADCRLSGRQRVVKLWGFAKGLDQVTVAVVDGAPQNVSGASGSCCSCWRCWASSAPVAAG